MTPARSGRANFTSVPVFLGGLKLDRGCERFRSATSTDHWLLVGGARTRTGFWKYALSGWSIAGITTFQSGTPFTVANGSDRNGMGSKADRPDIGNPTAPMNTRAIIFPQCSTGYKNPDTGSCVNPTEVHWVQGTGSPNASTVGRNTLRTGGTNNFDLNVTKVDSVRRVAAFGTAMGSAERIQSSPVRPGASE